MKNSLLLCIALSVILSSKAQDGSPDSSFGINGAAVITPALTTSVFDESGKLIGVRTAGGLEVYRYDRNGNRDATFGGGGNVVVALPGLFPSSAIVEVGNDGHIVVGMQGSTSETDTYFYGIARFSSNGSLDTSFGSGGMLVTKFRYQLFFFNPFFSLSDIALQNDNIIEALHVEQRRGSGAFLNRYHPDGTRDTSFKGSQGLNGFLQVITSIVVEDDGNILVAGRFSPGGSPFSTFVRRLNADGLRDSSFSEINLLPPERLVDFAVQDDGKITLLVSASDSVGSLHKLQRYHADGSTDISFGAAGIAPIISKISPARVLIQNDGKIIIGGSSSTPSGDFAVARYNSDGTLDTHFGSGGITTRDFGISNEGIETMRIAGCRLYTYGTGMEAVFRLCTDETETSLTCGRDTIIIAGTDCGAVLRWAAPSKAFPESLNIPGGKLLYKGNFNGHGYYESDRPAYLWKEGRDISTTLGGHLVTITDSEENNFIYNNIRQPVDWGAWIGLYNAGTPGNFAWVTGEPLIFTNWNVGEPNNNGGNAMHITEPYVHILGFDERKRWNDMSNTGMRFIAEFDSALYTYRQLSGPQNGSTQMPGFYSICYERRNAATGIKDTCCFNILVVCNSAVNAFCPADTIITTSAADCRTPVTWSLQAKIYPDSLKISDGTLFYKGSFMGHGYYESDNDSYTWTEGRNIANALGGHLVTYTNPGEEFFIRNNIPQADDTWGAWIGLVNTGAPGSFTWVTGEFGFYRNWNIGEPNNHGGTATFVAEPYVHILGYDAADRWNDSHEREMKFIAEFDRPIYSYRQISGIQNGSMQNAGVYTICYEESNSITMQKDTCCFTVTVNCVPGTTTLKKANDVSEITLNPFHAMVYPNPSMNSFTLKVETDNATEKLSVSVMDLFGRVVEVKNALLPNTSLRIGGSYRPGMYFVQVVQGKRKATIRLIKR